MRDYVALTLIRRACETIIGGDVRALDEMGIDSERIRKLSELRFIDLIRALHPVAAAYGDRPIDTSLLPTLIDFLDLERRNQDTIRALVRAGAPRGMVRHYFRMASDRLTAYRIECGPRYTERQRDRAGAARLEELERQLWAAWSRLVAERTTTDLPVDDYLGLHRDTGLPLDIIWQRAKDWGANRGG